MTNNDWGTYSPRGLNRFLHLLVQAGFAHGPIRRAIHKCWSQRNGLPVDIARDGLRFRLHPWDNTVESKLLFASRKRDARELKAIANAVAHGGVFVDVGANAGFYSLKAARAGATRVLAVEPIPQMFERLTFNVTLNDFKDVIRALPIALGAHTGNATLVLTQGDMGGSAISHASDHQNRDAPALIVKMKTLLEAAGDENIDRIDALKIDVEGFEDSVLLPFFESAPRSLWPGVVVIEHCWRKRWRRNVMDGMLAHGYVETYHGRSNAILELQQRGAA